ncbi:Retrotransposon gag protein [Gossypium australe]|uniref:Retrotransposon gag protein n=1 Tax=Gossypium australe TaxID=47621 RepID=A0A5B6WYY8_9ROSI|nr:Retrotransposon gag protein [Gossypium australe]
MEVSDSFKIASVTEDTLKLKLFPYALFKELLCKCRHHRIPHCIQLETFYDGLKAHTRMVVDASMNGALLSKSYNEAYEIIKRIASNNYQWLTNRTTSGK